MGESNAGLGRRELLFAGILLLAVFLFNSFTLRTGHDWGDDFAMYIHHAENLAQHRPYVDTGYVYNLKEAWYGPRTYPPVFPMLLAPVIAIRGLDFQAMKEEEVVAFTLSLLVVYLLFWRILPFGYRLALVAILGFNPILWENKDSITSDYPFWFFFLLAVLLSESAPRWPRWNSASPYVWGICTGLALYLAYGTRSVGLILLPGLAFYELVRIRRITPFALAAAVTSLVLIVAQRSIFKSQEASYADQFHTGAGVLKSNLHDYSAVIASFWPPSLGRPLSYLVFAAVTLLAVQGLFLMLKRFGLRPYDSALLFYIPIILFWPGNQGMRFMLPVLPLYLGYALIALGHNASRFQRPVQIVTLASVLVLAGVLYAGDYRKRNFTTIHEANGLKSFDELCRYIRGHAARGDVFVFYRARLLSLMTDRPASVYFIDGTPAEHQQQWAYIKQIGARYIVASDLFGPDRNFLEPVLREHTDSLRPVWHNQDFTVYEVTRP